MSTLTAIFATEFENWTASLKVIFHDHPRRFASFKVAEGVEVALSWRSDQIEPIVVHDATSGVVWLGVDQRVACVTFQGRTMFSIGLGSSLLDIKRFPSCVAILCDAELITVNCDYSVRGVHRLSDVPGAVELNDGSLVVTLVDGQIEIF